MVENVGNQYYPRKQCQSEISAVGINTILPKVFTHQSKSPNSSVPLTFMATASTNICERMDHAQELSEFQCGAMVGCYLCNKSSSEISLLLNIPKSSVSGIKTTWK